MINRSVTLCVLAAVACWAGAACAQDVDAFVNDRRACREAQLSGRIDEAFDCID